MQARNEPEFVKKLKEAYQKLQEVRNTFFALNQRPKEIYEQYPEKVADSTVLDIATLYVKTDDILEFLEKLLKRLEK